MSLSPGESEAQGCGPSPDSRVLDDVGKIAVLRANALGDYIFTLPALEALRARYPQAEIVLLGKPWHAEFVTARPGPVDRVVVVPPSQGVRIESRDEGDAEDPAEIDRFFRDMIVERFDLALQLHGGGRYSNPFVTCLGARTTAGLRTADAAPLNRWMPYVYYQNEVLRNLEAVSLVGARPVGLEPRIAVTERDLEASLGVVPADDRPLVALHPGALDPRRRWPVERFAALGDELAQRGARVVVTGTPPERTLVEGVLERMLRPAQDLCGRLSLTGLTGLLCRCRLVISNDSGPLHLAAAVGAPTVGLYWCGNLINGGALTRSRHRPVLSWQLDCPVCGRNCIHDDCHHRDSFLLEIPVEEVLAQSLDLLGSVGSHGGLL